VQVVVEEETGEAQLLEALEALEAAEVAVVVINQQPHLELGLVQLILEVAVGQMEIYLFRQLLLVQVALVL
jgi:ABC-type protease/lipase transport system fused ATPase/permease subunit